MRCMKVILFIEILNRKTYWSNMTHLGKDFKVPRSLILAFQGFCRKSRINLYVILPVHFFIWHQKLVQIF